jgi:hypothetical protein
MNEIQLWIVNMKNKDDEESAYDYLLFEIKIKLLVNVKHLQLEVANIVEI